jgi:sugar-specific transcriptional regulator TrmB
LLHAWGENLQSFDEAVETLINLGLTVLQAKVYLSLAKLGTSKGRATAKEAKVAPQDVYRVLAELQKAGLVEKIIAKPNKYCPLPIEQGLEMLIKRRKNQTERLERSVKSVSKLFHPAVKGVQKTEQGDFVLIGKEEPLKNRAHRMLETAHVSLDLMNEINDGMIGHDNLFSLETKFLNRGGRIRDILSKATPTFHLTKTFCSLQQRYPEFQARYLDIPTPAILMIKDDKEALISTKAKTKTLMQPFLWTDNPVLVQILQQWYKQIWEKSSQENIIMHVPTRAVDSKKVQ